MKRKIFSLTLNIWFPCHLLMQCHIRSVFNTSQWLFHFSFFSISPMFTFPLVFLIFSFSSFFPPLFFISLSCLLTFLMSTFPVSLFRFSLVGRSTSVLFVFGCFWLSSVFFGLPLFLSSVCICLAQLPCSRNKRAAQYMTF